MLDNLHPLAGGTPPLHRYYPVPPGFFGSFNQSPLLVRLRYRSFLPFAVSVDYRFPRVQPTNLPRVFPLPFTSMFDPFPLKTILSFFRTVPSTRLRYAPCTSTSHGPGPPRFLLFDRKVPRPDNKEFFLVPVFSPN